DAMVPHALIVMASGPTSRGDVKPRKIAAYLLVLCSASAHAQDAGVAPPDAGAAQKKAVETLKTGQLTPIVPSPEDITKPAFQLYAEIDLPVLGVGAVFAASRIFQTNKAFCAPLCNQDDLNLVDRLTAGYWSPGWQTASDIGLYAVAIG